MDCHPSTSQISQASGAPDIIPAALRMWQLCEGEVQFTITELSPCIRQEQDGIKSCKGNAEGHKKNVPGHKKGDIQEKERGEIQRTQPCHSSHVPALTFSSIQVLAAKGNVERSFTTTHNGDHVTDPGLQLGICCNRITDLIP